MSSQSKIDQLLTKLIDHWRFWDSYKNFYLNELAPKLVKNPNYGDEVEQNLLKEIRNELTDSEWLELSALIREKRAGQLREIEKERLRREAEEQARKKQQRRLEAERQEQARQEAQRRQLFAELKQRFEDDFLSADKFFKSFSSPVISAEEYEHKKSSFVQAWARLHIGTELDAEQASAIAATNCHIQVVARAGSGKTMTLVNRAVFLQKHCGVAPDQMLLVAFNHKAAQEMDERLGKLLDGLPTHVMTFHALAYAVVHPEESLLFDEPDGEQRKSRTLQAIIDDHLQHPRFKDQIRELMLAHFREDWERIVAGGYDKSREELLRYRRSFPRESLRGEYLKSFGEKAIADFLFEHDIPYKYERNFWWNGINYRPDFTIFRNSDSGIVIEYFGLAGDPDYDAMTDEKRQYWQNKRQWTLLEVTLHDIAHRGEDGFRDWLKASLENLGVACKRLSEDEIWHRIRERAIDRFTKAVGGFVQRCRKPSLTAQQLAEVIEQHHPLSDLEGQFLNIALPLYEAYLDRLEATGEEDFDGLMQRAAQAVAAGQTIFERRTGRGDLKKLRYVFVEEYQDFSDLFHRLIEGIRAQNPSAQFFCVGDDWQAINCFAGSDLRFYEKFQDYFQPSRRLYISTNYRSCTSIVEVGNALMQGLGKLAAAAKDTAGSVLLADFQTFKPTTREVERHPGDNLTPAVLRLAGKALSGQDVVLLSRKNSLPWYVNFSGRKVASAGGLHSFLELVRSFLPKDLHSRITISTAHKFKGLQKMVVIVLDAVDRSYPLIHPDWVFFRALGDSVEKIIDEERRLFYVALTRAVDTLVIPTEQGSLSPFLDELRSRTMLRDLDWSQFPPLRDSIIRLTVKIGNQDGRGDGPTYAVKDQLKAGGYQWVSTGWKSWCRTYAAEGFSIHSLSESSTWACTADGIEVRVFDDHDALIARYLVNGGQWRCIVDDLPEVCGAGG